MFPKPIKPMKKTLLLVLFLMLTLAVKAAPPGYAVILYSQQVGNFWRNTGDEVAFSFGGTVNTNVSGFTNMVLQVGCNEQDFYDTTNFVATNGTWNISGSLILVGTNLQVSVQFTSSDTNHFFGGTSFVLTNFNAGTNVIYLYQACDCGTAVLTSSSLTSPYLPLWDAYGAAQAATNGYTWLTARSNAWSLATATNGMNSGDFRGPLNSNGVAWVGVFMSNGVVRFKQLAP